MNNLKEKNPEKYQELIDQICDRIGLDESEVKEAKNVKNDLGFDSLDEVEMIMDIEKIFDLYITDEQAEETKGDMEAICNGIQRALEEKS